MGEQLRRQPSSQEVPEDEVNETPPVESEVNLDEVDKILEEIDSVLEENAEEFVAQYQQRGGQ